MALVRKISEENPIIFYRRDSNGTISMNPDDVLVIKSGRKASLAFVGGHNYEITNYRALSQDRSQEMLGLREIVEQQLRNNKPKYNPGK